MALTARERFEEAGWEYSEYTSFLLYVKEDVTIKFDKENKCFYARWFYDSADIDMETFKLITYQLEELGWL